MARPVERGQRASARTLPSDHRPPVPQPPRPGTPFSVSQPYCNTLPQCKWGKHLTCRERRAFAPPGLLRPTRHKFRCPKPYEDQKFKKSDAHVTEELQKLKALVKASANKRTLDPLKDLKENKKWTVPIPPRVPEGMSNPLSRDTRPSVLQPATRKRVASSVLISGKVKRSKPMSTVFEEPTDFHQLGAIVPATSSKHSTTDASEKFKEDHTVPGPSSADSSAGQCGQVISPHIQVSPHPSRSSQGDLGSSTSPQDSQGLSVSNQVVLEPTKYFQKVTGHSASAQASQRLPTCAERKIINVSSSRRSSKRLSPTLQVSNITNSPPKHGGQDPSGQVDLQQAPSDKEVSKPPSPKSNISDLSFVPNISIPTSSPEENSTCLTAGKEGQSATSSHKESQRCFPSPPKCPMQSESSKVSLRPDPADEGDFRISPLNQEGSQSPLPLKNGLRSSLTVQREINAITIPQVSHIPLISAQAESKLSTLTPAAQEPLPSLKGALESTIHRLQVETPESTKGTLVPSANTQSELAPSPSSPGVLKPTQSIRGAVGLSPSTEEDQRHVLKSPLSQKRRLNHSPAITSDPEYPHSCIRRLKEAPSKQRAFRKSQSDEELFRYPLPAKRALLTCHQAPNSHGCAKTLPVSHASSIFVQCAEPVQLSLPPKGTLGHSVSVGEVVKNSTYTSEMLGFLKPVQDSLSTTLSHKGTVGQDTSTKGGLATVPSLRMACGYDTSTKDVLGHISSVQKGLDPILSEKGAMGHDMHSQESGASSTSKEGDSLDSPCAQESRGPPQTSQETMGSSQSPQEDQPSSATTQDAVDSCPSAQRALGPSPCPQMPPEHLPNAPKALGSTLSSKGALKPILSIKLGMNPDTSPAEERFLGAATSKGGLEISLPAREALRPLTYVHDSLGEATSTQVSLVPSSHSDTTVKTCTSTQDSLRPFQPVQEVIGSTISEQGALQLSPPTQECFLNTPSLGGNSRLSSSNKVVPRLPISRKYSLRVDPSDNGGFRPSAERGLASSPAAKGTSKATTTHQVSSFISVQNAMHCTTNDQGTVESCQSAKGHAGHSVFPQKSQGPSLTTQKALVCSPSGPGLHGISSSLSSDSEHFTHAQGDLSLCQPDFRNTQPLLCYPGSKEKCTSKNSHLELVPIAQTHQETPMSSKTSKNPSVSNILAGEHLPSAPGSMRPSTSKQGHIETLPAVKRSLGCPAFSPGALGAQGTTEHLPPGQGVQKAFPSSIRYSGYSPHLPGDLDLSSSAQGVSGHGPPSQGPMESSCSSGFAGPLVSLQRPPDRSTTTKNTAATSPTTQGILAPLLSVPSKTGTFQPAQEMLESLLPRIEALVISPLAVVAPGPLPVAPEPVSPFPSSQETTSNLPQIHRDLGLSQCGSGSPLMPLTQGQQRTLSSSKGSVAPLSSVQGAVGQSLSAQQNPELSTSTQKSLRHSLSGQGDMAPSLSSQGSKGSLSSVNVDMETYLHDQGSPGHLKNVSGFPKHMLSGPNPVGISLPAIATKALVSSSPSEGSQGSLLSTKEGGAKDSRSAQNAQKLYPFPTQDLEPFVISQGPLHISILSEQNLHSSPSTLGDFPLQGTLEMSSPPQGNLEPLLLAQGEGTKYKSEKDILRQSISLQKTVGPSQHKTGDLGCTQHAHRKAQMLSSKQGAEKQSLSPRGAMGKPKSETRTLKYLPSEQVPVKSCNSIQKASTHSLSMQDTQRHPPSDKGALESFSFIQGTKKPLLSSQECVKTSSSTPHVQKTSDTIPGTLTTVRCKQRPLEHSVPVQRSVDSLSSTPGFLEYSASFQKKLGHSSRMAESKDTSPSVQGTTPPLPPRGAMGLPKSENGTPENLPSKQRPSLPNQKTKKTLLSSKECVKPSSSLTSAQETAQTTPRTLTTVRKSSHFTHKHLASVSGSLGMSSCVPRTAGTWPHAPKPLSNSSPTQASQSPPPSLQKSVATTLYPQVTPELNASAQISPLHSPSTQVPGQTFLNAKVTFGEPIAAQGVEELLPSSPGTRGYKESDKQELGIFPSAQETLGISLPTKGTLGSWSSAQGVLGTPLSAQGSLSTSKEEPIGSVSSVPKSLKHPTPYQRALKFSPSAQHTVQCSSCSPQTTGHVLSSQENQKTFLNSPGYTEQMGTSAQSGQGHPLPTTAAGGPLLPSQGHKKNCTVAQGNLPVQSSAQAKTHNSGSAEGALGHSAPSPAVSETNKYSPSTGGTSDTSRCTGLHLDLTTSLRVTPSSSINEQGTVGPCLSEEATKSKETTLGSSASTQGTRGHSLVAKATLGSSMSAKQTVETLPPTPGPLGSTQVTPVVLEYLSSDQRPLGISITSQGTLGSSSSIEAFEHSLSDQGFPKLSTSKQGIVQTAPSSQKTVQHPTYCQEAMRFSTSSQHTVQRSPASSRDTGPFLPSQKSQKSISYSRADISHSPSVLGAQEHPLSSSASQRYLLTSQKSKELSTAEKGTLPVQSSLSSTRRNLQPLADYTGILALGQCKHTETTLGPLSQVREDVGSSKSTLPTRGTLPPSPQEPGRHSSSTQGGAETFPFGQGYLAPSQSTQGPLKLSISAQAMMNTSQCSECSHNPLSLSSSEKRIPASNHSAHGCVCPCLSAQGTVHLSTCPQKSTQHSTSSQRLSSPFLHTQGIGTQSTSAHYTIADSPSSPVCQGYKNSAQKTANPLKSDQGSLRISASAQGSVEPLQSPQGTLGYSLFASDAQKFSTATPGHVISNDSPLDLVISAQLSSSLSSLSLLDPSISTEETLDFSNPTEGPLTSCQGPNESLNSPQRDQQTDPSASDPSVSMHSSRGPMVISLSGQGTLGSISSSLEPLTMSLSAQVNPGPLLSDQNAGGPCLSLQGNLEGCTCTHGKPGLYNASPGALEISASTIVSLGSSPSVQLDLKVSQPVLLSKRCSLSAQGVLGTSTSAQGPPETSLLSQEPPGPCLGKEALGYSPSNPEDIGLSDSAQDTLETWACMQNSAEIPPVNQEIIESLSATQDSRRLPAPSPPSTEAEESLPCTQSVSKSSKSVAGTLEALPSVSGSLCHLKPNEGAQGPLLSEQGILGTPAFLQESLELCQPAQGPLEPIPSPQDTMGTSFSAEFPGLSLCAEGDFIPTPSNEGGRRNSSYPKKSPRRFKSNQRILKHVPFPEGDIRYCLSELDALKCISSDKNSLTSSKYMEKKSSPTSTPQRIISPLKSSEHESGKPSSVQQNCCFLGL